jgi:hypothetical protein
MNRNITTLTKIVLGPGHVMEDSDPTPVKFRKPESKPPKKKELPLFEPPLETLIE